MECRLAESLKHREPALHRISVTLRGSARLKLLGSRWNQSPGAPLTEILE
jgi:hypothetical protein